MWRLALLTLLACGTPTMMMVSGCAEPTPALAVSAQTLEVGCGTCMFKQVGGQGCYWAAKVGDTVYPMQGKVLPSEQDLPSHGPEGMCTLMRTAVLTGEVRSGILYVTAFELAAVDPDAKRADPHNHEH